MHPAPSKRNNRLSSTVSSARTLTTARDRPLMSRASAQRFLASPWAMPAIPSTSTTLSATRPGRSPARPSISPPLSTQRRWVRRQGVSCSWANLSCSHSACSGSAATAAATKKRTLPALVDALHDTIHLEHAPSNVYGRDPLPSVRHKAWWVHGERAAVAPASHDLYRKTRTRGPLTESVAPDPAGLFLLSLRAPRNLPDWPQAACLVR
jgi:hypothetical protein